MATTDIRFKRMNDEYQSVRNAQDELLQREYENLHDTQDETLDKVDGLEAAILGLSETAE